MSGGVATRVAFWTGEASLGHDAALFWNDTNNRLGIGTSSPTARMHVNGTVRMQNLGDGSSDTIVLTMDGNGNVGTRTLSDWNDNDNQSLSVGSGDGSTSVINISGSSSNVTFAEGSNITLTENTSTNTITIASTASGNDYWDRSSGNLYPSTITDRVGIGTSNPSTRLHVNGNVRIQGVDSNSSNTRILTVNSNGDVRYRNAGSWTGGGDNDWAFVSGSTINDQIYHVGHVGIGTSNTPSAKLDVRGGETRIWSGNGTVNRINGSGDLYVEDRLEVDSDVFIEDYLSINTSHQSARLHIYRGAVNEILRLEGVPSTSTNTRLLTVNSSGFVRYRDMPNIFQNNDFRIEHYGGTYGQHDNNMKSNAHWNGICGRLEMDPDGSNNYMDYTRSVKTHRYWEVETVGHISTHGEARTIGCDYNVQYWNGSSWVNLYTNGVRKSYSTEQSPRHYHDRILFDLASLDDGTPIRGRAWNHNPSPNSDNSWSCGFNTGVHSNSSADHLHLGAREGQQN